METGRPVGAQLVRTRSEGAYWALQVENVPALGWKALKVDVGTLPASESQDHDDGLKTIENEYYKLTFDPKTGGLAGLYDKELNRELIDPENPWKIGQLVRETLPDRNNLKDASYSTVRQVRMEQGVNGDLWQSVKFMADLDGFEKGTPNAPKGIEWEIRLYRNVKLLEFRFLGRKEILTSPESLYVTFPFTLPGSRIVFETIGGILTPGQQLPGSSSDWNVAQNFVSVRGASGQIVMVSDEIPLWHFGGFNIGKFERNPVPGKPWLYSWVMNNYWTTNFRAYQEGAFQWTYQLTSMTDTTNTAASRFARGVRNPFSTRTLPAGKNELTANVLKTLSISGSSNVMIVNSRPAVNKPGSVLIHLREMDGLPGSATIASAVPGRTVSRLMEVNIIGDPVGNPLQSIELKPYEEKYIQMDF
jgi:alpha-mannosidase